MYLRGSKWSMNRRRRKVNLWLVSALVVVIAAFAYIDLVVVPVTPPLFVPTVTPTRSPDSILAEAQAAFAGGKLNQAIDAYQQAILVDPQNPSNYVALARMQLYAGDYENARINAENAILLNKNFAVAYAIQGSALGNLGEYLLAEAAIKNALALDANNAVAHAYYAEILALQIEAGDSELGMVDRAINESRLALDLDPNLVETRRARGRVLEVTGNATDAIAEYEAAIAINGNIADLHIALGRTYLANEQYDVAVQEFGKAYSLNPTDPLPNTYIAQTYGRVGEYAKAVQYALQAVKDGSGDPVLYGNLGTMYYRSEQYEKALEPLRMAVRGGTTAEGVVVMGIPLDGTVRVRGFYSRYGLSLARLNQCNEAVQISQLLIQTASDDEDTLYNANMMVQICEENITGTATPTPESVAATPTP